MAVNGVIRLSLNKQHSNRRSISSEIMLNDRCHVKEKYKTKTDSSKTLRLDHSKLWMSR